MRRTLSNVIAVSRKSINGKTLYDLFAEQYDDGIPADIGISRLRPEDVVLHPLGKAVK